MRQFAWGVMLCLAVASVGSAGARAQDVLRAAAVVNDEVISMLDLEMRLRLTILAAGLENRPDVRQRMVPQVMRNLIDERLQAQEAERLDINVSDAQVESAVEQIAQQNNMSVEAFLRHLEERGVIQEAMYDQVRAQLLWRALVARRLRPSVQISAEEVEEVVSRIIANRGTTLRRISEIFLAADSATQEGEARRSAERIFEQLRVGADFGVLARQFSDSATAPRGGDLGWIQEGQLAEEIDRALATMEPGTVSRPIRTLGGYYIIWLRNQRQVSLGEVTLDLHQILFSLPDEATADQRAEVTDRAAQVRERVTGCDGFDELARELGSPGSGSLGQVGLSDLPPDVREAVADLPIGAPSPPVPVPGGVSVLVVCERTESGIDRSRIMDQLIDERLNMLSRRYMRDLRRSANVDIRI